MPRFVGGNDISFSVRILDFQLHCQSGNLVKKTPPRLAVVKTAAEFRPDNIFFGFDKLRNVEYPIFANRLRRTGKETPVRNTFSVDIRNIQSFCRSEKYRFSNRFFNRKFFFQIRCPHPKRRMKFASIHFAFDCKRLGLPVRRFVILPKITHAVAFKSVARIEKFGFPSGVNNFQKTASDHPIKTRGHSNNLFPFQATT